MLTTERHGQGYAVVARELAIALHPSPSEDSHVCISAEAISPDSGTRHHLTQALMHRVFAPDEISILPRELSCHGRHNAPYSGYREGFSLPLPAGMDDAIRSILPLLQKVSRCSYELQKTVAQSEAGRRWAASDPHSLLPDLAGSVTDAIVYLLLDKEPWHEAVVHALRERNLTDVSFRNAMLTSYAGKLIPILENVRVGELDVIRTPYEEALHWIQSNADSNEARTFAKLLFSLRHPRWAVSFSDCVENLTDRPLQMALRVLNHYAVFSDDDELESVVSALSSLYPRAFATGEIQSPYVDAWHWITANQASGSALSLAKLLLSIWHRDHPFSFRECMEHLDRERTQIAVRVATHFAHKDQDHELGAIVQKLYAAYPRLSEVAAVMARAREELQKKWQDAEK